MVTSDIEDPRSRDDYSRFLVHLTRDYKRETACRNLINILKEKTIYARNPHCLFHWKIRKGRFSDQLKRRFNSVCFTEVPLHQVQHISGNISGRRIKLKPYGLVFWKQELLDKGANPAVYINAKGTDLKKYLIKCFDTDFGNIKTLRSLKKYTEYYDEIVQYYSLINIISDQHDFAWEREWRYQGDFQFSFLDIAAVVAQKPDDFLRDAEKSMSDDCLEELHRIAIIDPMWSYEQVIEELSVVLWRLRS